MAPLDGQVAMVTGAARGMGRSHAVALARHGADVLALDWCRTFPWVTYPAATDDDLAETARLVEKEGRRCVTRVGDVRVFEEVAAAVDAACSELGRVDILVANAGVSGGASIQIADPTEFADTIATNLTGVFHSLRAVAPVMIGQRYGRIVAVSSMVGRAPVPAAGAYVASKWGVIGLVKGAAQDLAAFGVTVNAVAPGTVDTPMVRNEALLKRVRPDLESPTMEDAAPFFRLMHVQPEAYLQPEEVSDAVLFLVGPGARHVTGAVIDINAGATARSGV